jgi:hypothetical protein
MRGTEPRMAQALLDFIVYSGIKRQHDAHRRGALITAERKR